MRLVFHLRYETYDNALRFSKSGDLCQLVTYKLHYILHKDTQIDALKLGL